MPGGQASIRLLRITTVPISFPFFFGQTAYLRERGFDSHAVSSPGELLTRYGDQEGMTVYGIEMTRRITPFRDLAALGRLWRLVRRLRPHIVHSHTPKGGLLGMIAAWLARVPVRIYHMHGLPCMTAKGLKWVLLRCSEFVACRLADQVLCVSHSIRQYAVNTGLCPAPKIKVLLGGSTNGVDALGEFNPERLGPETRQEARRQSGIPESALVVGFVGRIVRDKGIIELTEAWKTVRRSFPQAHLLVVGPFESEDPVPPAVRSFMESEASIHLSGTQWNTPPLFKAMDVFCLPSYREGFPITLLEAAAMQLPIVASRIPGCVDAVIDGVTGLLVPVRDATALAGAIQKYLEDPRLRQTHGQAGRERVLREFQQEAMWEATYDEYMHWLTEKGLRI